MSKQLKLILAIVMITISVVLIGRMVSFSSTDQTTYALIRLNNEKLIPNIGLGTWTMTDDQATQAVKDAVSVGYRHIDTAWRYYNEKGIGRALKELFADKHISREDVFITSKIWNTFHSRALAVKGIKESLENLGLDYLDLALIHWPTGFKEGDDVYPKTTDGYIIPSIGNIADTWKGMEDVYKLGLAKSIGVSNFNVNQLKSLLRDASIKPSVNQFESHPFLTQRDLVNFCQNHSIAVIAYSPLRQADPQLLNHWVLKEIAKNHNKTTAQVVLRWQIERNVIVIPKTIRKERMVENMNIFDFKLSDKEINDIYSLNQNKRVIDIPGIQNHPDYPFDRLSI